MDKEHFKKHHSLVAQIADEVAERYGGSIASVPSVVILDMALETYQEPTPPKRRNALGLLEDALNSWDSDSDTEGWHFSVSKAIQHAIESVKTRGASDIRAGNTFYHEGYQHGWNDAYAKHMQQLDEFTGTAMAYRSLRDALLTWDDSLSKEKAAEMAKERGPSA